MENAGILLTSRAAAWPTYDDVTVAEPLLDVVWQPQWLDNDNSDDDEEDRESSLSAYDDNTSTLEQMMTVDFNDDSQVRLAASYA